MTSTAFDDQFAVCTPEEEEFFREKQAHDDEQARTKEREQRAENDAVNEMAEAALSGDPFADAESDALTYCSRIYAAIKAGRIPGVVLGAPHE